MWGYCNSVPPRVKTREAKPVASGISVPQAVGAEAYGTQADAGRA